MENDNITNDENSKSEKYNMPLGMKREDIEAGADMSRSTEHASDKAENANAAQMDGQARTELPANENTDTPEDAQSKAQSKLPEEHCVEAHAPQQAEQHTLHVLPDETDADVQYVLSGNVEDFTYDLYVKKCAPEVRDALAFLNMTSEWELRKMDCYPDTEDGLRLTKAAEELRMYVEQHCGSLRLFFMKYKGQYIFTTCILDAITYRLDISFDMIINRVNGLSDMDLLCYLLSNLHMMTLPYNFVSFTAENKERFKDYINGAAYTEDVKEALLDIYDSYNFADLPNATLRESLIVFLKNYFVKFKEVFTSVRDVFEKLHKEIVDEIKNSNELPGFINDFLFRKTIMQGKEHKIVTLEFLPFAAKISDYYGMPDTCLICAGYGCEESSHNYDAKIRIGNKIKYFASVNAEEILDILREGPHTVQEIVDTLNVSKTCVYRLIKKFLMQDVLLKESGDKYRLNRSHLENIIRLLETYGGI